MVNAAKACLQVQWNSQCVPSMKEWFRRINKITEKEQMIHIANETPDKYNFTWACWLHFHTTGAFNHIMNDVKSQTPAMNTNTS